jgi:hypothetical protein
LGAGTPVVDDAGHQALPRPRLTLQQHRRRIGIAHRIEGGQATHLPAQRLDGRGLPHEAVGRMLGWQRLFARHNLPLLRVLHDGTPAVVVCGWRSQFLAVAAATGCFKSQCRACEIPRPSDEIVMPLTPWRPPVYPLCDPE